MTPTIDRLKQAAFWHEDFCLQCAHEAGECECDYPQLTPAIPLFGFVARVREEIEADEAPF